MGLFHWRKDDSHCSKYSLRSTDYSALRRCPCTSTTPMTLHSTLPCSTRNFATFLVCVSRCRGLAEYGYDGMRQSGHNWWHDNHKVSCCSSLADLLCMEWVSKGIQDVHCIPQVPARFEALPGTPAQIALPVQTARRVWIIWTSCTRRHSSSSCSTGWRNGYRNFLRWCWLMKQREWK